MASRTGGVNDDLDGHDRMMADERRIAVLVQPTRVLGNAPPEQEQLSDRRGQSPLVTVGDGV